MEFIKRHTPLVIALAITFAVIWYTKKKKKGACTDCAKGSGLPVTDAAGTVVNTTTQNRSLSGTQELKARKSLNARGMPGVQFVKPIGLFTRDANDAREAINTFHEISRQ